VCGSGSFVISAAKIDPRMRAIATVSMYDMGAANRDALNHSLSVEQRKQIIAAAAEQRYVEFEGGRTEYTGGTVHALTPDTDPIQREFYDFYRTPRGEFTPGSSTPQLTTHPTLTSNVKFMNFFPFNDIETISPRPMLFIAGDQAHSREFSEDAYKRAAEPKELVWIPGAGHVDLYDRVDLIPFDKLGSFFTQHLA
ncbi:MAG: alpha/beta hydrolase, partial [Gammaproteobacteria bacterium]